jgi:hypothetical protein
MTFKGGKYEALLDIWQMLTANKYLLEVYKKELQYKRLKKDLDISSCEVKVQLQENFVREISNLQEEVVNKVELLANNLSDIETQIFLKKFIIGQDNKIIMNELGISQATLYRYFDNIKEQLDGTSHGTELLEVMNLK